MPKVDSTSPDVTGISLKVGGVVAGLVLEINPIIDKSRGVQKYKPLNEKEYNPVVAMGSLEYGAFTSTVLYDPEATEGINAIEDANDANTKVTLAIELNNSLGANGTIYTFDAKVSTFKLDGDQDGKFKASFSAEIIGTPVITAAAAT